jgi:hypothetical protein
LLEGHRRRWREPLSERREHRDYAEELIGVAAEELVGAFSPSPLAEELFGVVTEWS